MQCNGEADKRITPFFLGKDGVGFVNKFMQTQRPLSRQHCQRGCEDRWVPWTNYQLFPFSYLWWNEFPDSNASEPGRGWELAWSSITNDSKLFLWWWKGVYLVVRHDVSLWEYPTLYVKAFIYPTHKQNDLYVGISEILKFVLSSGRLIPTSLQ